MNSWIHKNTQWKSFIHSCGSVFTLVPDFIEAGSTFPSVQCSAAGMNPKTLKTQFGRDVTFWGGAVIPRALFPSARLRKSRRRCGSRIDTFGPGGGFVFNAIHNIQPRVPVENLIAMIETFNAYRKY